MTGNLDEKAVKEALKKIIDNNSASKLDAQPFSYFLFGFVGADTFACIK